MIFATFDYYFYLCTMHPLEGQSKDNIGLFSLRPIFFCSFLNFSPKIFGGFKEIRYICSILQNYRENDNEFIKETIFARYGVESGNAPMLFDKA